MKKFLFLAFLIVAIGAQAQVRSMYNATNTYTLTRLQDATAVVDTVTNTGSGALYSKLDKSSGNVTIQVDVTKVSGTVAGTMTLYGSIDGAKYTAINTEETSTVIATETATDATNSYNWRVKNSPFLYYQVGWVGTGTMVATFTAKIMIR